MIAGRVSVVITTRDRPVLVRRAIASVLAQTYPDVETIVVDHGSEPPLTLERHLHDAPGFRLVRAPAGIGATGAARNVGIEHATGEFVAFLDDDDHFRPDKVRRQVERLRDAPRSVAAVECGYDLWAGEEHVARYAPPTTDLASDLLRNPRMQPSTVLVRRRALLDLGGFHPDLRRTDDWEFWVRFADAFDVEVMADVLVDREVSTPDAARSLLEYEALVEQLRPRIEALPADERRDVLAWHTFVIGVMRSKAGDRRGARRAIWSAWRSEPRRVTRLLHLGRTLVGEQRWQPASTWLDRQRNRTGGVPITRVP